MTLEENLKIFKDKGFKYDPKTGIVTSNTGKIPKAKLYGYTRISIRYNDKTISIFAHQYAWYYIYNKVPFKIDHINRDRTDNRIINLRDVTHQQNCFNRSANGYSWIKRDNIYISRIMLNGVSKTLGYFHTPEEAHQAYIDAKKIYHII